MPWRGGSYDTRFPTDKNADWIGYIPFANNPWTYNPGSSRLQRSVELCSWFRCFLLPQRRASLSRPTTKLFPSTAFPVPLCEDFAMLLSCAGACAAPIPSLSHLIGIPVAKVIVQNASRTSCPASPRYVVIAPHPLFISWGFLVAFGVLGGQFSVADVKALQLDTVSSLAQDFVPYALAIPSDRLSSSGRNIQVRLFRFHPTIVCDPFCRAEHAGGLDNI
jgi:hypothetical protein